MKICVIIGTRPEIIKMSSIMEECQKQNLDYFIIHTGQHYSYNMDGVFRRQLGLSPKYNLNVNSDVEYNAIPRMITGINEILVEEKPDIVLVEGDTSSVLAGAMAACKLRIAVGHIEAGLRCFDKFMPEELNRTLVDHCSKILFTPTDCAKENLAHENLNENVFVVGNTIADVIKRYAPAACSNGYMLLTLHRQENVDDAGRFNSILKGIDNVYSYYKMPIIYPIHPRSKKMLDKFGFSASVNIIEPLDYFKFLKLLSGANLVLTDSGGLQEESCIMGIPCITLRDNTERPETINIGANILAGVSPNRILESVKSMFGKNNEWHHPYGDGFSGKRIIEIIRRQHG